MTTPNSPRSPRWMGLAAAAATVLALAVPAVAAAPGGKYAGKASDDQKVSFSVSADQVKSFKFRWGASCADASGLTAVFRAFTPIEINGRSFSAKGTGGGTVQGLDYTTKLRIKGRFSKSGKSAVGSYQVTAKLDKTTKGKGRQKCDTGKVTYRVKKR